MKHFLALLSVFSVSSHQPVHSNIQNRKTQMLLCPKFSKWVHISFKELSQKSLLFCLQVTTSTPFLG